MCHQPEKRFRSPVGAASGEHLPPAARAAEPVKVKLEAEKAALKTEKAWMQQKLAPMTAAQKFTSCPADINDALFNIYRAMSPSALQEQINQQKDRIDKKDDDIRKKDDDIRRNEDIRRNNDKQNRRIDKHNDRISKDDDTLRRNEDIRNIPAMRTEDFISWTRGLCRSMEFTEEDESPCFPKKLALTWKCDVVKAALIVASNALSRTDGEGTSRLPRILGLRLGSGFGKTHVLLDAPKHLDCPVDVYITYNGGQDLDRDVAAPQQAILLRILLRLVGVSNVGCPKVFARFEELLKMDDRFLMDCICDVVEARLVQLPLAEKKMFIGIDEIGLLIRASTVAKVQSCTSAPAKLVVALQSKGIVATVLVSALTEATFATTTGRPVPLVELPVPDMDGHHFIRNQLLPAATPDQIAQIQACCGFHFRSIALACLHLLQAPILVSLPIFVGDIVARLGLYMTAGDRQAVRNFICCLCTKGRGDAFADYAEATKLVGADGTVPPLIVHLAYKDYGFDEYEHPAYKIFSVPVDPTKQLESCGYEYDRFRARCQLPIVPWGMQVNRTPDCEWFAALRFDSSTAHNVVRGAILESMGKGTCRVRVEPMKGNYYFPSGPDHPWIDRAAVAYHVTSNEECLVLYQDDISKDFSEAVKDLNAAARTFADHFKTKKKKKKKKNMRILCVANIVGESDTTAAQSFEFPFLLIRDSDVKTFYTPTFAPAILFCRHRHRLAPVAAPPRP